MNILDDNSENVLLQKNPIWEILFIGIGISIFITAIFFIYLFGLDFTYSQIELTFFNYKILISNFSLIALFLSFLITFLFPVGWTKNISLSKSIINFMMFLTVPLIFISILLSMWGIVTRVSTGGLLDIIQDESSLRLYGFNNVMFIIAIIGAWSFKYLKDKANEHLK